MKFGEIIKSERLKKKWRQGDLGKLIGRSQTNISGIEDGKMPKFDIACLLCEIFNLKPTEVWEDIKDEYIGIEKIPKEGYTRRQMPGSNGAVGRENEMGTEKSHT